MPKSILFVCLGNICRSPLAEGVLRSVLEERGLAGRVALDSAGTGDWHAGKGPDPRSTAVAAAHGVDISCLRARQIDPADFDRFDLILGLDRANVADLRSLAPAGSTAEIGLYLDYALGERRDVPDPYYGTAEDFRSVYRMIRQASESMLARWETRASPPASGQVSSTT